MDDFRIPKEPARVLADMHPRPPEPCVFYLSTFAERHRGAETVSDLLAGPALFFPARIEGDGMVCLRRDALRWVKVMEPEKNEWLYIEEREGSEVMRVKVEFLEGDALEGDIRAMGPEGERRVLDVANGQRGFLPLEGPDGLYLVNLARLRTIRLLTAD